MILLSMPMTTQNAKNSCFISLQQKIKEQHTWEYEISEKKNYHSENKTKKKHYLNRQISCWNLVPKITEWSSQNEGKSIRLLDYAFSCLTPDTNNQMQILNLQPHPEPKNTSFFSCKRRKKRVSAVTREEETQPVSSKGDIISKTDETKFYCFPGRQTSKVIVSKRTAPSSSLLPPYHSEVLLMLMCKMSNSRKLISIKTTNNKKQTWNERF